MPDHCPDCVAANKAISNGDVSYSVYKQIKYDCRNAGKEYILVGEVDHHTCQEDGTFDEIEVYCKSKCIHYWLMITF